MTRLRTVAKGETAKVPQQPICASYLMTLDLPDSSQALLMVSREGNVYSLMPNGGWLALNMMEVFDDSTV